MAGIETRDDSLSTLPESRKKETSGENRLATTKAERGDERIGLDGNGAGADEDDSYHQASIEQSVVSEMPVKLADAASNCSKIKSTTVCDKQAQNCFDAVETTAPAGDIPPTSTVAANASRLAGSSPIPEEQLDCPDTIEKSKSTGRGLDFNAPNAEPISSASGSAEMALSERDINARDFDRSSTPGSVKSLTNQAGQEQLYLPTVTTGIDASGYPSFPAPIYPFAPYFANPFMAPFVAHLPQAQGNDTPAQHSSYPEGFDGKAGRFATSYSNAEFVAHAKYYRELLQQYLRSMENSSYSSESEVSESTLSSAVNLKFDPETGVAKMTLSEAAVPIDCNANNFRRSPRDSIVSPDPHFRQSQRDADRQSMEREMKVNQADSVTSIGSPAVNDEENRMTSRTTEDSSLQSEHGQITKSSDELQETVTDPMSDAVSEPTSGQAEKSMPDSDNSAAALIKKQISEIEKQILRNAQNQNTRKMDSREVEAFLSEQKAASCVDAFVSSGAARSETSRQQPQDSTTSRFDQASRGAADHFGPAVDSRALYDRAASTSTLPGSLPSQLHRPAGFIDSYFNQTPSTMIPGSVYPPTIPWQANMYYPAVGIPTAESFYGGQFSGRMPYVPTGIGQLPAYGHLPGGVPSYTYQMGPIHAYPTTTISSSGEMDKPHFRKDDLQSTSAVPEQPAGLPKRNEPNCVAAVEMSAPSSSGSSSALSSLDGTPLKSVENFRKANLPCDSASIDSIGSFRETNDDDDGRWVSQDRRSSGHHADDEDEPVWVLRESYVRKLKREEERKAQKERYEAKRLQQSSLESADKAMADSDDNETDKLLGVQQRPLDQQHNANAGLVEGQKPVQKKAKKKKEVMIHEPAVLIEGVLFRARYLGSTQLACDGRPSKMTRMMQAQEAVGRIKAPDGEHQPFTDVDLFISTEKIMVLNADLQDSIMMDHPLRTISYIADIGDLVVLMARRVSQSSPDSPESVGRRTPKIMCHVFESDEAQFIAQSIGQAFQVAYMEFLRANGIEDTNCMRDVDYQEVLNAQEMFGEELEMFARKETERDVVIPKQKNEILGVVIVESGWGSMLPTVVIANLMPSGPAARSNQLNIGDHIITINGISLVGLPLSDCQNHIRSVRHLTAVKLTVVRTAPVVEVRMRRPDTKYQLGFSVQNGVICSLLRGGIGERGGVRVGHRIIEINSQSVVAVPHETVVTILASAVGEIHMKTMPTSMYRLLTGQETPNYL